MAVRAVNWKHQAPRSPLLWMVGISVCGALITLSLRYAGFLQLLELEAYDWTQRIRTSSTSLPSPYLTLITITEQDIRAMQRWPISDRELAMGLKSLLAHHPRAVGFDIYRDLEVPPGREELNRVLSEHRSVVGVLKFGEPAEGGIPPPPILEGTDQVGFSDIPVDPGGIVRRGLLFLNDEQTSHTSFALLLALRYLAHEGIHPQPDSEHPEYLKLGKVTIPPFESNDGAYVNADAGGYQFLLHSGARRSFPTFTWTELVSGQVPAEAVRDKIVLLGVVAEGVKDYFYTSYSRAWGELTRTSGVELHANIIEQLLDGALHGAPQLRSWTEPQEILWIGLWSVLGGIAGLVLQGIGRYVLFGVGGLVVIVGVAVWVLNVGWWIPVIPPALAWTLSSTGMIAYMAKREKKERDLVMQLFSRHVSAQVAERIWQERNQFLQGGRLQSQKLVVTALFSDLVQFTTIAEKMDPQELIEWLNAYMDRMAHLVMEHGGIVDDYYGDAIKANFGVPFPRASEEEIRRDAVNAVTCALAMKQEIGRINHACVERGFPLVHMRIGIQTGEVVAGSLGSAERLKYTTIGDPVNVAARLESLKKEELKGLSDSGGCRILVGEATHQYLDQSWQTRNLGQYPLKGRHQMMAIYQVEGKRE